MTRTAIVFSGYNTRAVVALCRFFTRAEQDFAIVSSGPSDPIHATDYGHRVRLDRAGDVALNIELFEKVLAVVGRGVYCPTSEFLNAFVFAHALRLERMGLACGMAEERAYAALTEKKASQDVFGHVGGMEIPAEISIAEAVAPCVLKPYRNVGAGKMLYPILCETAGQLSRARSEIAPEDYFAKRYVSGQSYYLCGYLSKLGAFRGYWQENLLQQPNGKSIVLARTCANPGLSEEEIISAVTGVGFHGPFMVEVIKDKDTFYYIETNPRFWGPLQLGLDCCDFLSPYLNDWFGADVRSSPWRGYRTGVYYSWAFGARQRPLKIYPASAGIAELDARIENHDIFNRPDTAALHLTH